MHVLISGSTGLVGTALASALVEKGHTVRRLIRGEGEPDARNAFWRPERSECDHRQLEGIDAAVHLSGENIGSGLWTETKRRRILESRTQTTSLIVSALQKLRRPPAVFIAASAVGYYGSNGDRPLTEKSPKGRGFLADVCEAWEAASEPIRSPQTRLVQARLGIVLSRRGGALPMMLLPFRLGVGGRIGDGRHYLSWISLDDVVSALIFCLEHDELSGPVNLCGPSPVTNSELTRTVSSVLRRPAYFPVPALLIKLLLGQMAEETILSSLRVEPQKLAKAGFSYQHPRFEDALRAA